MSIKTSSILQESSNFLKNRFGDILLLSLISAVISATIYHSMISTEEINKIVKIVREKKNVHSVVSWIQKLSKDDKTFLIRTSFLSLITIVVGFTILTSSVVAYLNEWDKRKLIDPVRSLFLSLKMVPKMLILLISHALTIYFGFLFFILPGIMISIGFSLSPIILIVREDTVPFKAMIESWNISFRYFWQILFIWLVWIFLQMFFSIIFEKMFYINNIFVKNVVHFTVKNLFTSFVLICFFRLYTLSMFRKTME
ncbi:YciC family protein [Candidatus Riesia pediculischaeffi]|uniref:Uncharacterized protein n=1 Tax=Candidatus Riesia pediculischaeffi TaxID=428411 RepID=A0A1V0HKG1_9ENTR|nr:YciC family protein [Candidatus Riesia pediculischaeffi]ARC53320.1 hypothetical protein AOQ87_01350 [Candidatus Riesia pediculischaeffi]